MAVNPADSPVFGTLYGSDAMRAVFDERAFLQRMLDVEAALARVQGRMDIIPADAAEAIIAAAKIENLSTAELAASARNVGYPVVGLVSGLTKAAGAAGGWTHWGATTQDIMDTATVLQVRQGLDLIENELSAILTALAGQADTHRNAVMAGRTHLQQALPVTFGLKCAIWAMPFLSHRERLGQLRSRVLTVEFAGAAGTLASLGDQGIAVMEALATELGLGAPLAPWHVCRDALAETVGFLGLVCGSLAKIATDIILLAQTEVGEVAEPYVAGRGQSSTMPQKRNPIASEYIIAAARMVQGLVPVMLGAMAQDHERATGPWQAEALALPQAFVLTHGALLHTRAIAEGMVVDAERMRANLELTYGALFSQRVLLALVERGLSRDEAYRVVQRLAQQAIAERTPLRELLGSEPAAARLDLDATFDYAPFVRYAEEIVARLEAIA
jgi:3-carboxy-cis,cis-muconate cycloisomerase